MSEVNIIRQEMLRRQFIAGCIGKRGYPSPGAALRAKDIAMRKGKNINRKRMAGTEPYPCKFCGDWHLGHSDPNL